MEWNGHGDDAREMRREIHILVMRSRMHGCMDALDGQIIRHLNDDMAIAIAMASGRSFLIESKNLVRLDINLGIGICSYCASSNARSALSSHVLSSISSSISLSLSISISELHLNLCRASCDEAHETFVLFRVPLCCSPLPLLRASLRCHSSYA